MPGSYGSTSDQADGLAWRRAITRFNASASLQRLSGCGNTLLVSQVKDVELKARVREGARCGPAAFRLGWTDDMNFSSGSGGGRDQSGVRSSRSACHTWL